jgi:transcriptional regulator with XRE-family HTH domain
MSQFDSEALGERLRTIRQLRGLTLKEVAEGTGLTTSFLSRLERGQTGVTVESLIRLADVYGVPMVDFFDHQPVADSLLIPSGTSMPLNVGTTPSGATSESLIPRSGAQLQATLYRTPPLGSRPESFVHAGEEFVFVIEGSMTYFVGAQQYEAQAGDGIWHRSTEAHRWTAGPDGAVTLHVNTPPYWG